MEKYFSEMREFFRELHAHPELSEKEFETSRRIEKKLREWEIDFEVYDNLGIVAWVQGGPGRVIAFRADIDALPIEEATDISYKSKNPGLMHACGHDVHTAIHLYLLKLAKDRQEELQGTIKVLFQPAEETIGGADYMIKKGALKNPQADYALGLHVAPHLYAGQAGFKSKAINAATANLKIGVKGLSGHGAYPHLSVDAIAVTGYLITEIQSLISRRLSPLVPAVISLGSIKGGSKNNIISNYVELEGTVRALECSVMDQLEDMLERLCQGIALAHGARIELSFERGYPALVNDCELHKKLMPLAREALGEDNVIEFDQPSMGADDFAFLSREIPSSYYFLGSGIRGKKNYPIHHEKFLADELSLEAGLRLQWELFKGLSKE